jgi:hypothetical protein
MNKLSGPAAWVLIIIGATAFNAVSKRVMEGLVHLLLSTNANVAAYRHRSYQIESSEIVNDNKQKEESELPPSTDLKDTETEGKWRSAFIKLIRPS